MFDLVPFLILIVLAVLVVVVAGRLRFRYTIALVGLGFLLGLVVVRFGYSSLPPSLAALLTPPFFFDILLPPIVFEAAIHIDYRLLRGRLGLVLFLVVGGVLFTTLFTGLLVTYLFAIPILAALLLAAILSPTDPVAVIDLFRRLDVPARALDDRRERIVAQRRRRDHRLPRRPAADRRAEPRAPPSRRSPS